MELYIVRHGIAIDQGDPKSPPEPERYLTEEGIEKTKQVARGVAELGVTADLMISSTYVRAVQTAEIFASALDYSKQKIRKTDLLLPGADPAGIFRELAKEKQKGTVFLFGHAPQVDALVSTALGLKHPFTTMKKAAVACVELKRVSPPGGDLLWLAVPKMLKKMGK